MLPGTPLLHRSLRQTLGRAIAHPLSVCLRPADSPLPLMPPALAAALAHEQALLRTGKALRLARSAAALHYDWAIALRLYPHLRSDRNHHPYSIPSRPALAHRLADALTPLACSTATVAAKMASQLASESATGAEARTDAETEQGALDQGIAAACELLPAPPAANHQAEPPPADQAGLLQIVVGDRALALWLQAVLALPVVLEASTDAVPAPIFWMQAAHARSCSLLRQGEWLELLPSGIVTDLSVNQTEQLEGWSTAVTAVCTGGAIASAHAPTRPAAWYLLRASVAALDGLAIATTDQQRLRLAQTLSQQIWAFDANCRLLATAQAASSGNLAQTQVRLMILAIACKLLRYALTVLGFPAPCKL